MISYLELKHYYYYYLQLTAAPRLLRPICSSSIPLCLIASSLQLPPWKLQCPFYLFDYILQPNPGRTAFRLAQDGCSEKVIFLAISHTSIAKLAQAMSA